MGFELGIPGAELTFAFADGFNFRIRGDVDFNFDSQWEAFIELTIPFLNPLGSIEIAEMKSKEFRNDLGRDRE